MIFSIFFFFKQKTAYEMRISDWSSDVCSSDLRCWNATDSPWTTSARERENFSGRRHPDVPRVQGRRPRHVEFRSRPRQRQDHESARQGLRLARLHPPLQRGRSAVRDQERQDRPRRRAQGWGAEEEAVAAGRMLLWERLKPRTPCVIARAQS